MSFDIDNLRVNEVKRELSEEEQKRVARYILWDNALTDILGEGNEELIDKIIKELDRIEDQVSGNTDTESAVLELEPSFAKPSFEPGF